MATPQIWSNVGIVIQSALGSTQVIDSISKANPGVLAYQGADPTNGAYILLTVQGMTQVDGRVFRIANVNAGANTLELEGENTTSYDTFASGTMQVVTFGTTLSVATDLQASGGEFEFIDVTTIHDTVRKQIPGPASPAVYTLENLWDVSDAGLIALKAASDAKAQRCVRFNFSTGQKLVFNGYIGATLLPTGNAQDKVVTSAAITMFGKPSVYST